MSSYSLRLCLLLHRGFYVAFGSTTHLLRIHLPGWYDRLLAIASQLERRRGLLVVVVMPRLRRSPRRSVSGNCHVVVHWEW